MNKNAVCLPARACPRSSARDSDPATNASNPPSSWSSSVPTINARCSNAVRVVPRARATAVSSGAGSARSADTRRFA
ncbi:hypothetical protein [Nocardia sp. NPDC051570]|uniref:hypothetical protein n=1 Tax=Nocardia sp. NPDC051570 TaxID=3364324 RepID=UPI003795E858